MLDGTEYAMSWGVYLMAALILVAVWWRVTRPIPWYFPRQLLRILLGVILLVPAPVAEKSTEWAPALFVLLFDVTLIEGTNPLRGLTYLLYGLIVALLVLVVDILVRKQPSQSQRT